MRRVLVYAPRLLPLSQTFVVDQARALGRWSPRLVGRERLADGLDVDDLLAPEMRSMEPASGGARRLLGQVTRRVPVLQAVAANQRPDLIHAHFLTGGFDVLSSLSPLPCPVVVTAHGFDATWFGSPPKTLKPQQWLHGALRRRLLHEPVHFIGVSRYIRDELVRHGAPPERVTVHHTGVDTSYFKPPEAAGPERRGILFVGRLVPKKGVDDLLTAVVRLRAEGLAVPVEIIGEGPLRGALERTVRKERLDVSFGGPLPRRDVLDAMRRAAVLCAPSRRARTGDREGFGMVLAEAQSTGLPVVATASGGMVDAVNHGRTGLLVAEGNTEALSAALRSCLTDREYHARLSGAARPWAIENFDLVSQTKVLEEKYDSWARGAP